MLHLSDLIYYFGYLAYLISGLSLYQHYLYSTKLAAVAHIPLAKGSRSAWKTARLQLELGWCNIFTSIKVHPCPLVQRHTFLTGELRPRLACAERELPHH